MTTFILDEAKWNPATKGFLASKFARSFATKSGRRYRWRKGDG